MVQAKKKRRREAGAVSMAWGRRSDRQVLFLLARLQRVVEPVRTLAAAGPGLRRVGRVAILRGNLGAGALALAGTAENVLERITFGLDQREIGRASCRERV